MKTIIINENNRQLVEKFLINAGESLRSFTYFDKRDLNVLDNHEVTLVLMDNNEAIGYGHLDREDENVWLGIAVSESHTGKGCGKKIMHELIAIAKARCLDEIKLSVYKDNAIAQKLYEKLGFEKIEESEESFYYKLEVDFMSVKFGNKNPESEWNNTTYPWDQPTTTLSYIDLSEDSKTHPVFFETGTNMGHGVRRAVECGFKKVISVDIEEKYYELAKQEFTKDKYPDVDFKFALGNSADLVWPLISEVTEGIVFWLDGHGCGKNPLHKELEAIGKHPIKNHIIMIDDVRMMGEDSEYTKSLKLDWAWGKETAKDKIAESVLKVNKNYNISYLDSPMMKNDIMLAQILE